MLVVGIKCVNIQNALRIAPNTSKSVNISIILLIMLYNMFPHSPQHIAGGQVKAKSLGLLA